MTQQNDISVVSVFISSPFFAFYFIISSKDMTKKEVISFETGWHTFCTYSNVRRVESRDTARMTKVLELGLRSLTY